MKSLLRCKLEALRTTSPIFTLVLIVGVALGLRLYHLGFRSLWFDEAISALAARYDLATIGAQNLDPMAPPLYFLQLGVLTHGLRALNVPVSEASLRLLSTIFSAGALIPVYAVARRLFNSRIGLCAAGLMAVLPVQVFYAQEARAYGLVILWASVVLWLFVRVLAEDRRSDRWWLAVIGLLGVYIHYLTVLLIVALHIYALTLANRRQVLKRLALVDLVLLVGLLPMAGSILYQTTQLSAAFRLERPSILAPLLTITFWLFGYISTAWFAPLALFIGLALMAVLIVSTKWQPKADRNHSRLLLTIIGVPMFIMIGLSYAIRPIYFDRYFAFASPALAIYIAQGIERRPKWLLRMLLVGVLLLSVIKLFQHYTQPDPTHPPFREVSAYISTLARPADVVFHLHDSTFPSFKYYTPTIPAYLWQDDAAGWLVPSAWKWFGERIDNLGSLFEHEARIWVIYPTIPLDDSRQRLITQIAARYPRLASTDFESVRVELYAAP